MQAQTTLINFTVTKDGLEDQLLADVVAKVSENVQYVSLSSIVSLARNVLISND